MSYVCVSLRVRLYVSACRPRRLHRPCHRAAPPRAGAPRLRPWPLTLSPSSPRACRPLPVAAAAAVALALPNPPPLLLPPLLPLLLPPLLPPLLPLLLPLAADPLLPPMPPLHASRSEG